MLGRIPIIAAAACLLAPPLAAQSSSSRLMECGTGSTQRVQCEAGGQVSRARLVRDLSGGRCGAAGTWGWADSVIWTDNTCRGQFEVSYATSTGATGTPTTGTSDSTRRIVCGTLTTYQANCSTQGPIASVRLFREANFANCTEGKNWGHRDTVIWAGNGCRAEFEVTYRTASTGLPTSPVSPTGPTAPTSPGPPITRTVTCGSTSTAQARCNLGVEPTSVRLARDLSGSRCREGYSWGRTGTVIWTSRGCRGEFAVTYRRDATARPAPATPGGPTGATPAGTRVVTCGDTSGSAMSCNTFGTPATVRLQRDRSNGRCGQSQSWGLSGQAVWVARGCYGDFQVTYVAGAVRRDSVR